MLATKVSILYTSAKVRARCSYLTHRGLVAVHCQSRNDLSGKIWNREVDIKHMQEWLCSLLQRVGALVPCDCAHSHLLHHCTRALTPRTFPRSSASVFTT